MTNAAPMKKRDVTRGLILESALKLFQEQGFEKTTMRAIADECGLTPGATYYHFNYKEELLLEFYRKTSQESLEQNTLIVLESDDFKHRFQTMINFKFEQLLPYRELVHVLAGGAGDMQNPLSPFSTHTRSIRDEAIQIIEDLIEGSNLKLASNMRPHIAKLLWLYQLGIIFFWSNDQSKGQRRTSRLLSLSLDLVQRLLQVSSLPLMGGISQKVIDILTIVEQCTRSDQKEQEI